MSGMDRQIEQKKGLKKKHFWMIGGGLVFLVFLMSLVFGNHESTIRVERDKVSVSPVTEGLFNDYIRVIGTVEPIRFIYLDATEGGRVEEIINDEGAMVKKGDIILKLSNPDLKLNILTAEARLAEQINFLRNTRIQMEQDKLSLQRNILEMDYDILKKKRKFTQNKRFYKKDMISEDEYLASKEDYDYAVKTSKILDERQKTDSAFRAVQVKQMEYNLDRMKTNLDLVKERMDNLDVKAPIDGQIGLLDAEIGQSIPQGSRIGQVNDLSAFKVTAQVDEHYIDRVKKGLKASFTRQDKAYDMTVKKVYPEVRNGTFKIDMVFDNEVPKNIRSGQTYHVELQLGQAQKSVLIPRGGFFQSTGGQWIFVLTKDGSEATRRNIRIGRQNPQYYEVLEGLEPGEQVITSGYDTFGDNQRVVFK
ncbi:ABC transporter permease [Prolixibacter bellariivorans]|uniref:ABC transporter permease n=1 Tax=Prolixibacter bellariivorans TaxID=314319 RepID=A0A5M4AXS7_9BACT|nr:efflux RND transporter periplasmic adaptor subunit [Prolixibacter bellariivorans]GET32692.1 ABC transporter permease [Prolixibacter bellariivorans]